jgi:hypothetical protein
MKAFEPSEMNTPRIQKTIYRQNLHFKINLFELFVWMIKRKDKN